MKSSVYQKIKPHFFPLLLLSFVFLTTSALVLSVYTASIHDNKQKVEKIQKEGKIFPLMPVLSVNSAFPLVSAQAALAVDLKSMMPLYEKNPDEPYLPASTTKIITALVAMDYYPESEILAVDGGRIEGQKMGLVNSEKVTAGSLIEGLLISSANDAAYVLAKNFPGGEKNFVDAMNTKAKLFHLDNTHFENPIGFDDQDQITTARDLVRIAIVAMENPKFAQIVKQKQKVVTSVDGKVVHRLISTNKLLENTEGVLGVKTGWTENAHENLVTYINRDGKKIIIALLGSQDRFNETKELLDWIFSNYEWKEVRFTQ